MAANAYYPQKLKDVILDIDKSAFTQLIKEINLELGRFDGMLSYNREEEIVKAFLLAEEVLSAASLEWREVSFYQYLDQLLEGGYETDDLTEMRYTGHQYKEVVVRALKQGFSLGFLTGLNQQLYDHRYERGIRRTALVKERHPWLIATTQEFDKRLYYQPEQAKIDKLMADLKDFIVESDHDPLITIAIAYGQLLLIYPFHYAVIRTVASFIPYIFNYFGLTREKSFYLSGAFRKDRDEFYRKLSALFRKGDWESWIAYFLEQVIGQALSGQKKADHLVNVYNQRRDEVEDFITTSIATRYIRLIYQHPILNQGEVAEKHGLHSTVVGRLVKTLEKGDYIYRENRKRSISYLLAELYEIFAL